MEIKIDTIIIIIRNAPSQGWSVVYTHSRGQIGLPSFSLKSASNI